MVELLLRQLEAADLLLVNKADLASEAELQASQLSAYYP